MSENKHQASGRSPLDWPLATGGADAVLGEIERLRGLRRKRRRRMALLTSVAACLLAGGWFRLQVGETKTAWSTADAPLRRELPDGSVAELKAEAEIAVDYSGAHRNISLLRGAAHFKVAKNASRPFVVNAGGIQVRAVGTAFEVALSETSIAVVVDEGRVAVEEVGAGEHAVRTYVSAGNQVVVDLPPSSPADSSLAARSGAVAKSGKPATAQVPRMDLAATPLSEIVAVFNRYGDRQLVLADPALGAVQLSGVLRADNVDALVKLLATNYGIKPEIRGNEIILGRAP